MDLVSIVIPNFNKERYLPDTLKSIHEQTYFNWEAILVDDGSTDNSLEIANSFREKDKRFVIKKEKKQSNGGAVCRNIGLQLARGKYVLFFDSDDILEPFCLERRVWFMEEQPNLDFAVFPMQTFKQVPGDHAFIWQPKKEKAVERFLMHELPWQTMQPLFNRSFLSLNALKFDESFPRMQDVEFNTQVLLQKPNFEVYRGKPDCYFRIGLDRMAMKPIQFYEKWSISVHKYILTFKNKKQEGVLSITALYGLSELLNAYHTGQLKKHEVGAFYSPILKEFSGIKQVLLKLYFSSALLFSFHIPGHRGIFKFLLKLINKG